MSQEDATLYPLATGNTIRHLTDRLVQRVLTLEAENERLKAEPRKYQERITMDASKSYESLQTAVAAMQKIADAVKDGGAAVHGLVSGVCPLIAENERLELESRKWFRPSGAWEYRATAEEVMKLREEAAVKLGAVEQAIRDCHLALDKHEHGTVAQDRAFEAIERAMGMPWKRDEERQRREGKDDR